MTPLSVLRGARLLALLAVGSPTIAWAAPANPHVDCAIYKAKIKQWKEEEHRGDWRSEGLALNEVNLAQMKVLAHLGYSPQQLKELQGWNLGGDLSNAYFFPRGKFVKREVSIYKIALQKGLIGKEQQAVAFCSGLGINVSAFAL